MQENEKYAAAAKLILDSEAVLVSASNGLSIAEGYHIFADNDDFKKYFGKFRAKYGVDCLIRGVFTPMTNEDKAEYMRTVHRYLIDDYHGSQVMRDLLEILGGKNYFIVTSNGDTHFQMNGFDKKCIFEVEGNFDGVRERDAVWQKQAARYQNFIRMYTDRPLLVLELGIGARNQLIKAPLMQMVAEQPAWHYLTLNMPGEILIPQEIADRSLALPGNIADSFTKIKEQLGN